MKSKERNITFLLFLTAAAAIILAAAVSLCIGKYPISPAEVWSLLRGGEGVPEMSRRVFFTLRLPRTIMGFLAGVGLGMAGSVYQIIFKNPLASPDIIGIAGGANLGAAAAIVLFSSCTASVAVGAFWGGLLAVGCVMLLVRATGSRATATYVLAGIVINAVSKACIMALKYFADPENQLAAIEYWEMGTFGNTTASKVVAILPMFLTGLAGILLLRRQIELMSLGDDECRALGVQLRPIRTAVLVFSTLLVASVISVTGLISFAGLIAPHTARLMLRRNNSLTICMSGLVGSVLVMGADILARVLYSAELPISILTTVIGVPILVYFLCRGKENL